MVKLDLLGAFTSLTGLTTTTEYHLKTKVICGDPTKDNLYVTSYHTGAGTNDVALIANASAASKGFLNSTHQQFHYGTSFPWGLKLAYPTPYTEWLTAEIDVGYGDAGFLFNGSGLVSADAEWVGWLACGLVAWGSAALLAVLF